MSLPDPVWYESLRRFWFEEDFDPSGKSLLLAVSGGCDSVALLNLFHAVVAPAGNCRLHVIHINHRLRPDSDGDQAFVEQLCRSLNIPLEVEILDPATRRTGLSVEMWGREKRYQAFSRALETFDADLILTAHHRDDVIETFCLRLWRGTGFAGLGAIPFKRGRVLRPLLPVSRAELRGWLVASGRSWREDASNADLEVPRNWIRHNLLPAWCMGEPGIEDRIFGITREASKLRASWEGWLAKTYPVEEVRLRGGIPVDWLQTGEADAALLRHLLPVLGVEKPLPQILVEILRQARNSRRGISVRVNENTLLNERNGVLVVTLEKAENGRKAAVF